MEEEGNQQEMRRLITQRDNRVRAESFRQQLDDLQASEAAALQRVRSGRMAMQMAPQPQQLLLEYAQARVAEQCGAGASCGRRFRRRGAAVCYPAEKAGCS